MNEFEKFDVESVGSGEGENPQDERIVEIRPFFGAEERKPQHILKVEQPHHRVICYLAAQGDTNTEIAEKTGFTTAMVANTKKQPWAQELIAQLIGESGEKAVKQVLRGAAVDAAEVLVDIMNGSIDDVKPAERAKAANAILDRLYGTAPQIIKTGKIDPSTMSDEELAAHLTTARSN